VDPGGVDTVGGSSVGTGPFRGADTGGVLVETTHDVIVVGGGGSGLAAAVSAAENGATVLLLEKEAQLGGTTGIAVGSFTASCTVYQQRAGIDDNPDDHEEDASKFGPPEYQARNNSELRRFLLGEAANTLNWLIDMGLAFHGPSPEPPNRVHRMHNVVPNAKAYIATLQSRLLRYGGTILCNVPVRELTTADGRVTGLVACVGGEQRRFRARWGVVLAAGDYANSPELIARHKGPQFANIEGINPYSTGDGHCLAESVGAKMVNMDVAYGPELRFVAPLDKGFMQLLPASGPLARLMGKLMPLVPGFVMNAMIKRLLVTWQHPEDSLLGDGAILVNARGERFCNETVSPDREIAVASQPDKICYILLDERLVERYSGWPHFISTAPEIAYAYVKDYLRLRRDVAVAGDSPEAVAVARNVPADALRTTVGTWNRCAAQGYSDRFGRTGSTEPLSGSRWVLLGPAKAYFTTTEGGAAINQRMQVLDEAGRPIPGLYAVGQNGLGGQVLWGHGLHIAWALTSGRLAGQVIMRGD